MKKLALILIACSFLFSSCKKSYTCTCVNSASTSGNSYVVIYPDETKAQATTNCLANEAYQNGGSATIKCTLN